MEARASAASARGVAALLVAVLLLSASGSASAASSYPAKVLGGLLTSTATAVAKKLWSLKSTARTATAAAGRSMVKYEGGYAVETVFDGSNLGIEPYSVEVTPAGDLLVLDSMNSNLYRVQLPLSRSGQSLSLVRLKDYLVMLMGGSERPR